MKPLSKVKIKWSPDFAYAVGLLTTDGNLSPDGRHVVFVSKDKELINNLQKGLKTNLHIGKKANGTDKGNKKYFVIQIGDVNFYNFLLDIGLMPKKSKIIKDVQIPQKYFFDFLRGHLDGDGSFYSYWDPRWRSSFMFYTAFASASHEHILWLQDRIFHLIDITGHITKASNHSCYQLKYAKMDSIKLFKRIYYSVDNLKLNRKYLKIIKILDIMRKMNAQVAKLVNTQA